MKISPSKQKLFEQAQLMALANRQRLLNREQDQRTITRAVNEVISKTREN
jgi:hypothetical protein